MKPWREGSGTYMWTLSLRLSPLALLRATKEDKTMEPIIITGSRIPSLLSIFIEIRAITIGPWVFCREASPSATLIAHESIHVRQWFELALVGFVPLYVMSWLFCLLKYRDPRVAYLAIPFEQEAREYEERPADRVPFGWVKYDM